VGIGHNDNLVIEAGECPLQRSAQGWLIVYHENTEAHDATWLRGDR